MRLFISGIPPDTAVEELAQRLSPFGQVLAVNQAAVKVVGGATFVRNFVHVDMVPADEKALDRCIKAYNGSNWKGHKLCCQTAHPTYLERLQLEWLADMHVGAEGQVRTPACPCR
jgi:hypothetical protein